MKWTYEDRVAGGKTLAGALKHYTERAPIVLALPRGGVPVAAEVVWAIGGMLDVLIVRKLGLPMEPEIAMGALAEGGEPELDHALIRGYHVGARQVAEVISRERLELARRARVYRDDRPLLDLRNQVAIVVDDGVATGASMKSALRAARHRGAARVVAAIPVGNPATLQTLHRDADEVVCPMRPPFLRSVGEHYEHFEQLTDDEVLAILHRARQRAA